MTFDQQLRLAAIGVGAFFIVGSIIAAAASKKDIGCLVIIVVLFGISLLVFGFTGSGLSGW